MTRPFARLPIKVTVPLLLTLPVAVMVVVLSLLAFRQGRYTVNDLASQNLTQVHERIGQRIDALLSLPERFNRTIAALMRRGHLDPHDPRSWRPTFLGQAEAFRELSAMDWGTEDGRVVWLARYAGKDAYSFAIKDEQTGENVEIYNLDAEGGIAGDPINAYPYDPRKRPWYTPAIEAGGPAWSEPFLWVPQDDSESTLGISYSQPFRDTGGRILGVHDAEISLHDLSLFLEGLAVAKTGKAFITDDEGLLIATSTGSPVASAGNDRLAATQSADTLVAAAARHMAGETTAMGTRDGRPYQTVLEHEGRRLLLMVSPFERGTGLRWLVATLVPEEDFLAGVMAQRRRSILIGLAAVALTLALGVLLGTRMVRPFLDLVAQVRGIAAGELDRDVKIEASPEFALVSAEINRMTEQLRDRERLESELAIATQIQMSMLPGAGGASSSSEGYEIAAVLMPAKAVGGDLYDFFPLQDGRLCVIIGDVSDKGVPAALFMAKSVTLARLMAAGVASPAAMVPDLNRELCRDNDACMFVTFLCAFLDPETGEVVYASAGHDPPALVGAGGGVRYLETEAGAALGLYEEAEYEDNLVVLAPDETLVLYTDGVTEATNGEGAMYTDERLLGELSGSGFRTARDAVRTVLDSVHRFEGGAPQADDITVLALSFRPGGAAAEREAASPLRIEIEATAAEAARAADWVEETLRVEGVPLDALHPLRQAATLVLGNLVHRARKREEAGRIEIGLERGEDQVSLRLASEGPPFNPVEGVAAGSGTEIPAHAPEESGIGRLKVQVDRLEYVREGGCNVVRLVKSVPA